MGTSPPPRRGRDRYSRQRILRLYYKIHRPCYHRPPQQQQAVISCLLSVPSTLGTTYRQPPSLHLYVRCRPLSIPFSTQSKYASISSLVCRRCMIAPQPPPLASIGFFLTISNTAVPAASSNTWCDEFIVLAWKPAATARNSTAMNDQVMRQGSA